MNFPLLAYANEIEVPTLMIAGENAHSRYMSEDTYKSIGTEKKELFGNDVLMQSLFRYIGDIH